MDIMHFEFTSDIYPFTHTTQRQMFTDPRYQEQYLPSKTDMQWQIKQQMMDNDWEMIPSGVSLGLTIIMFVPENLHRRDLSNQVKAIEDALQGLAFPNDGWVDYIHAIREQGTPQHTIVQVIPDDPERRKRDLEKIDLPAVFEAFGLGDVE